VKVRKGREEEGRGRKEGRGRDGKEGRGRKEGKGRKEKDTAWPDLHSTVFDVPGYLTMGDLKKDQT